MVHFRGSRNVAPFIMLKNILNHRLALDVIIFVLVVSVLFIYSQKNKDESVETGDRVVTMDENITLEKKEVMIDENIAPEWALYTHPSLGYTIEYPKNMLPSVGFGDESISVFFYKKTYDNDPHLGVAVLSPGMRAPEWDKTFFAPTQDKAEKIGISGIDADMYVITNSKDPNSIYSIMLIKDGIAYKIGFRGLSASIIDHVISSFHINFVPKNP